MAAADFHKMPLFVQTGNVKPMYGGEFPSAGQRLELICWISTFHCQQATATDAQVSRPFHESVYGTDCAREHCIEAFLRAAVNVFCETDHPRGCITVLGATNCTRSNEKIQDYLRQMRLMTYKTIRQRLERGVKEGDVPAKTDLNGLASFYTTVLHGLSIQARDNASRKALGAAVDYAMSAWDTIRK